jgi:hypothetical protein
MELPVDIYESILLHADIDNVLNVCLTSTAINILGNDKHVWFQKFEISHLPIITKQKNIKDWINEYKKVNYARFYSKHVIELILEESKSYDNHALLIINFKVTDDIINLLPSSLQFRIRSHENYINIKTYNDYKQSLFINSYGNYVMIRYYVGDVDHDIEKIYKENDSHLNLLELQSLFFTLLYHFPQMNITDDSGGSYLKINNLDELNIVYFKILQKRNDFWENLKY